jgi:hypothetical protein
MVVSNPLMRIQTVVLCATLLLAPAWGDVLVRWTELSVPPAKALGVRRLVVSWDSHAASAIRRAGRQGYDVFAEVPFEQAISTAELVSSQPVRGMIVDRGKAQLAELDSTLHNLRSAHPKLLILLLDTNGRQPVMRGQTITTRDGMLQVSSPTAQPWLDSNLAAARFEQEFSPDQPPLYTFQWEAGDSIQRANGPSAEDYSLAIAEAGAIHADLVLNVDRQLQKGLAQNQPAAWAMWNKVKQHLFFASSKLPKSLEPWANVGVLTDNYDAAYEPINLMGRHNIPYRVLRATSVAARDLNGLDVITVFSAPDKEVLSQITAFANQGGTVVLVNLKGTYPWQSAQPVPTAEHALSYTVGRGRVIDLGEPVGDPETFAQDVRRLIPKDKVMIGLWNALTTIAIPYRNPQNGEILVELVNYAEESLRIQMRMKGSFSSIRYQVPGHACCQLLAADERDGFTEVVIPSLSIAGRVRLTPAATGSRTPTIH